MARTVTIELLVNDKGTATIKRFASTVEKTGKGISGAGAAHFQKFASKAGAALDSFNARLRRWGTMVGTLFAVGIGVAILRTGAQFEQAMANMRAVLRPTEEAFQQLTDKARALGRDTVFTSVQAAEAMERLSLAGFKASEILGVMDVTLDLAAAGQLDMAEAARITANVMRGLSLEVKDFRQAADSLVFAATNSNQTISDMGHAFKFIGPVANVLNADIKELSAALAVLANVGLRGEMAGTGLRRAMTVFLQEIEAAPGAVTKLGLNMQDLHGKSFSLADALDRLTAKGVTAADIMKSFGQRAGPNVLAMMGIGSEAIRRFERDIIELGGNVESLATQIADIKLDTTIGDFTKLKSALADLSIELFDAIKDDLRDIINSARSATLAMIDWVKAHDVLKIIGATLKIIGTLMAVAFGAGVVRQVQVLTRGFVALNAALSVTSANLAAAGVAGKGALLSFGAIKWVGLPALVGAVAWQVGRLIGEFTGLDDIIREWTESLLLGLDDASLRTQSMEGRWKLLQQTLAVDPKLMERYGPDIEKVENGFTRLRDAADKMAKAPRMSGLYKQAATQFLAISDEINANISKIDKLTKQYASLDEAMKANAAIIADHKDLWEKARGEGEVTLETFVKFQQLVAEATTASMEETEAFSKELKKLAQGAKSALLDIGVAWDTMQVDATQAVDLIVEATKSIEYGLKGITREQIIQSQADQFIKMGEAAIQSGQMIDAAFRKDFEVAVRFKFDSLDFSQFGDQAKLVEERVNAVINGLILSGVPAVQAMKIAMGEVPAIAAKIKDEVDAAADATKEADRAAKEWKQTLERSARAVSEGMHSMGQATYTTIAPYVDQLFTDWIAAYSRLNMTSSEFATAMAADIVELHDLMKNSGLDIPDWLEAMFPTATLELKKMQLAELQEETITQMRMFAVEQMEQIATLGATALLEGQSLSEAFDQFKKQALKGMIQMLFMYIKKRLAIGKIEQAASIEENTVSFGGVLAKVFGEVYQSISAIPMVGPFLAPALAAAAFALVLNFGKKLITGKGFAQGGLVTGPGTGTSDSIPARLSAGEFVIRKNAVDQVGVGALKAINDGRVRLDTGRRAVASAASAPVASGGGTRVDLTVQVNQTFTGDNWQESGVSDSLREQITESVRDAILNGTSMPLPVGVR